VIHHRFLFFQHLDAGKESGVETPHSKKPASHLYVGCTHKIAMTNKRVLILVTCIVAAMIGACGTVRFPYIFPRTSYRAKYDQVRRGMAREDVQKVMEGTSWSGPNPQVMYSNGRVAHEWYGGPYGSAHFDYNPDGKLEKKSCSDQSWEPEWLEAVRWRLGL
jgi:hypothetical protein